MTLTKKTIIREIGRLTCQKKCEVQTMLEALIEVWTEELVEASGRIEVEGVFVLETRERDPKIYSGFFDGNKSIQPLRRISLRMSRKFRKQLNIVLKD